MSKMTKTQLKSIVKECLVEILSEGLGSNDAKVSRKRSVSQRNQTEEKRLQEHRQNFDAKIGNTVSNITSDPIMQSILQDTARTTLQEQLSNETPGTPGSSPEGATLMNGEHSAGVNLESIFDGSQQNWGKLAFDE